MTNTVPEHDKLFDEICSKLSELSKGDTPPAPAKFEKMQEQMKKFNSDLNESQFEIEEKIKNLEKVSFGPEDLDKQLRQMSDQLIQERTHNSRLSSDLAKALELGLQLQLEIQGLKSRSFQIQSEEKKFSHALLEKCKVLQRELELLQALKEETSSELTKAKSSFAKDQAQWDQKKNEFELTIQSHLNAIQEMTQTNDEIKAHSQLKDEKIEALNAEIDHLSKSFSEVESSAQRQSEVLKNLMDVAERKIIEMKLALDKKSLEAQDYHSHLQQALTQNTILQQENQALKDYANKLNAYHQQAQAYQMQQIQAN